MKGGLSGAIARANAALKEDGVRLAIEEIATGLRLRGTLPPKPEPGQKVGQGKPYRQRINLGHPANRDGLRDIKALAYQISQSLRTPGAFDWESLGVTATQSETKTVGDWVKEFEADYFSRKPRTAQTETTWRGDYRAVFKELDPSVELTAAVAIAAVKVKPPETRQRKRWCLAIGLLCQFAGVDVDLKPYRRGTSARHRKPDPKPIPTDDQIAAWLAGDYPVTKRRDGRTFQWAFATIAAFGLRPHEALAVERIERCPTGLTWIATIGEQTKTGARTVRASRPDWVERWQLWKLNPPTTGLKNNRDIGGFLAHAWRSLVPGSEPFTLYGLRHAHGMRCEQVLKIDPAIVAIEMGHSVAIHLAHYSQRRESDREAAFAVALGGDGTRENP